MVAFGTRRITIPTAKFLELKPNMKTRTIALLLTGLCLATLPLAAQSTRPVIFPDEDSLSPENLRLVWPATPGLRYEVRQSTNLQSWSTAPGFPATANGPAQQMPFQTTGNVRFFQVRELDEQPPAIASQYPPDGGFAVPRFANITLQLTDATGINPNSIRLTVGTLGTFTLTNPPPSATNAYLTFTNGLLTFLNGGSLPLGAWGSNITATLVVADTRGYTATNTWRFDLEVQAQVASNLFVFGSPQAQRTGQQIGNIPTAALARRFGPIPMGVGDPWTLELVASNRLELSYTNTAPGFATNLYVCNLTPVGPEDVFNRKIISLSDNPGAKRLTLFTVEVPLTELVTNAAVAISGDSRLIETGTNGLFVEMLSIGGTIPFPRIGYSLDGAEFNLKNANGFNVARLTLEEEHWWLTPSLQVGMEINWGSLKRFEAIARGNIQSASIWNVDFLLAGVAYEKTLFELSRAQKLRLTKWILLGYAGPVPVFASLGLDVKLKGRAEVTSALSFRVGKRETADAAFGLTYTKPDVQWVNTFIFPPPQVVPFTAKINAEGSVKVSLEPAVEFLVFGLAGLSAGITPSAGVVFEVGTGKPLTGRFDADVSFALGLAGPAFDLLDPKPEFSTKLWADQWHLFPDTNISFTLQPQSQTVPLGDAAYFSCSVASTNPPAYQWYFNNVPLPGKMARTLSIPSVTYGHAGNYQVRVSAGGQTTNSATAQVTVVPKTIPAGMALIPAGPFVMGDTWDGDTYALPLHTNQISAFYMDRTEVTKALWDEVRIWANTNGYDLGTIGLGKATNHPVHTVSWYDVVKWCNARSEQAGLVPAYYTSAAQTTPYRTGQTNVQNDWVKWSSGYRLPTEAEWEKAARGGVSGQRFPWGNTISWTNANYYAFPLSAGGYMYYDVNPTSGYHPTFNDGVYPYTSPVGYFPPNGYGLYDMAGNLVEWTWDWYGSYSSGSQTDPRGPSGALSNRVLRGGHWSVLPYGACCAARGFNYPSSAYYNLGFRCVRGL
jgi:formylglycine-generating enzyme required for sulfatase activity